MELKWKYKKSTNEYKANAEERIYFIQSDGKKFSLQINGERYGKGTLEKCKNKAQDHINTTPLKPGLWWTGPKEVITVINKAHVWTAFHSTGKFEIARCVSLLGDSNRFTLYGPRIPHYSDHKTLDECLNKCTAVSRLLSKNHDNILAKAHELALFELEGLPMPRRGPKSNVSEILVKAPQKESRSPVAPKEHQQKTPTKKTPTTRTGKGRGYKILGYSSLPVIHWMGKNGFTLEQAKRVLHKHGITTITDANLKCRLTAGKGKSSNPAPLATIEEDGLRVDAGIIPTKKARLK